MADYFDDDKYVRDTFTNAVKEHLKDSAEYPLHLTLGNAKSISLNTSTLIILNEVFSQYQDKLYDENKYLLDFKKNPNISLITNKSILLTKNAKEIDLNLALTTKALDILSQCNKEFENTEKILLAYKDPNLTTIKNTPVISPISLYPHTQNTIEELKKSGYKFINISHPLQKTLSLEHNYHAIVQELVNKPILNPNLKYKFNQDNNIFKKLPDGWEIFTETLKNSKNKHHTLAVNEQKKGRGR